MPRYRVTYRHGCGSMRRWFRSGSLGAIITTVLVSVLYWVAGWQAALFAWLGLLAAVFIVSFAVSFIRAMRTHPGHHHVCAMVKDLLLHR